MIYSMPTNFSKISENGIIVKELIALETALVEKTVEFLEKTCKSEKILSGPRFATIVFPSGIRVVTNFHIQTNGNLWVQTETTIPPLKEGVSANVARWAVELSEASGFMAGIGAFLLDNGFTAGRGKTFSET